MSIGAVFVFPPHYQPGPASLLHDSFRQPGQKKLSVSLMREQRPTSPDEIFRAVSQDGADGGIAVSEFSTEIYRPNPFIRSFDDRAKLFFTLTQRLLAALALNRVTDGSDQGATIRMAFDQIILRSLS